MLEHQARLKTAQEEAARANKRMLEMLIGFEPMQAATISSIKFIAEWAGTLAYDATAPFRED